MKLSEESEKLREGMNSCFTDSLYKVIVSNPRNKQEACRKIVYNRLQDQFQAERYTEKQVFHENISFEEMKRQVVSYLENNRYRQLNAWDDTFEYAVSISKGGKILFQKKRSSQAPAVRITHNRQKNYLIQEGTVIPPLVDMGIFTAEGKIVRAMYDKFKQINRFVELFNDELERLDLTKKLTVIDFGCGKSYLTFIIYYFLVYIRHLEVEIIGLDLKKDVIAHCNEAARKYGYTNLHFEMGDINGYQTEMPVDIVMTLHACDTATDYALYSAICWNTKLILSVPCCQHELNKQIQSDAFSIVNRYGIVQERMAALMTDAIRGNLLTYSGYETQLLEFVDLSHTPKNILIRAVRTNLSEKNRRKALEEAENLMKEFHLDPTLYRLAVPGRLV